MEAASVLETGETSWELLVEDEVPGDTPRHHLLVWGERVLGSKVLYRKKLANSRKYVAEVAFEQPAQFDS